MTPPGLGRVSESGSWQPGGASFVAGDRNGGAEAQSQARGAQAWQAQREWPGIIGRHAMDGDWAAAMFKPRLSFSMAKKVERFNYDNK